MMQCVMPNGKNRNSRDRVDGVRSQNNKLKILHFSKQLFWTDVMQHEGPIVEDYGHDDQ